MSCTYKKKKKKKKKKNTIKMADKKKQERTRSEKRKKEKKMSESNRRRTKKSDNTQDIPRAFSSSSSSTSTPTSTSLATTATSSSQRTHKRYRTCPDCHQSHSDYRIGPQCRYIVTNFLGSGSFAKVTKAYDTRRNEPVAIKIVTFASAYRTCDNMQLSLRRLCPALDNEARLLKYFDDRGGAKYGVLPIYDVFRTPSEACLVMPCYGPDLYKLLKQQPFRGFPLNFVRTMVYDVLRTVKFLHQHDYVHTDIKPENLVLLNDHLVPSVTYGMLPESPRVRLVD